MDIKDTKLIEETTTTTTTTTTTIVADSTTSTTTTVKTEKCEATSTSLQANQFILKHELKTEPVVKLEKLCEIDIKPKFTIDMTSRELQAAVKQLPPKEVLSSCNVLGVDCGPPSPPDCPPQKLTREQLQPPTPSVFLENKKHAFSPQLQEFCLKHPIAVVRQLAAALKLGELILLCLASCLSNAHKNITVNSVVIFSLVVGRSK